MKRLIRCYLYIVQKLLYIEFTRKLVKHKKLPKSCIWVAINAELEKDDIEIMAYNIYELMDDIKYLY